MIPQHVALIMDGNRRWARDRNLPQFEGHRRGEEVIEPLVDCAISLHINYLTFWAFSTENWYRDKKEVEFLLDLFRMNLDRKVDNFHKKNVRINVIGNLEKFPPDLVRKTGQWMEKTRNNNIITVNIALSYGGRDEIVRAVNKWKGKSSKILTKQILTKYLDTYNQPDPDLLIRTGGEMRLSGFMLWQLEYTELYFTRVLWPDFTPLEFKKALNEYSVRKRRFGL
ncbi:di-trans,poly-cis-decaprenylcistransferase [Candidatus Gottesmanbacteria bacterium RIFCSPHIGHO2_02_FULL_40_24]|uniref:Isoprenyl transferase n=1 Tax=Candidatus Gottesmanbacteria bacterium RIFCSPHIGHO2_01_FULL_40_15 TaxID=1798376 RepID=A0A1F5Z6V5_9BACT|nr:MAG: di-trans,poly-cis-decaprenylcistransferase [Candidatus Gottesmanbacteria bacterium RIFCSPHIGHO2_01_FULL_40_15]OGG18716.1 MAG: di-trans,poly-cis-decaprenylcistransferase [Candidatus Gottesmanbacteria bacterium RIFCSPHIGHO2_02_FULL_40_24]OGG21409.1 MAG: di-trans,poly-cis-decaprenylcistransferase [Candidatus Gottesmanbacteria bacterium RIFCSPLOWO2_01_FULL_40_10]OGG23007.1 MAG: di-trans,poly-cis-decaprenylcistransferase [Candidatus Gottesmanbacteria bacterium RIFCSPHIGHO2_12_FULL_40_13]OGG3